jgi:hypothetical protein
MPNLINGNKNLFLCLKVRTFCIQVSYPATTCRNFQANNLTLMVQQETMFVLLAIRVRFRPELAFCLFGVFVVVLHVILKAGSLSGE